MANDWYYNHSNGSTESYWSGENYFHDKERQPLHPETPYYESGPRLFSNLPSPNLLKFDNSLNQHVLDDQLLLDLCNAARASLHDGRNSGSNGKIILDFLRSALADECNHNPTIQLSTIAAAKLDKLIADMMDPQNHQTALAFSPRLSMSLPERLQRRWRARFREDYFDLDQKRYSNLPETGLLRDIEFNSITNDPSKIWRLSKTRKRRGLHSRQPSFEPGE